MEELVLKGGNAIDLAYGTSLRATVHPDFSMGDERAPLEVLRARLSRCLETAFVESGLVACDIKVDEVPPGLSEDIRDFWGAYKVEFKLIPKDVRDSPGLNLEDIRR